MKKIEILKKLRLINKTLENDGFIIDGIFGSHARDDYNENSDIDILYHLDEKFYLKYSGFIGFKRLNEINEIISKKLNKKIDLAPINNLSKTGKKYILDEVIYV